MGVIVKPDETWDTLWEKHDEICSGGAAIILAEFEKDEHNYSVVGYFDDPETDVVTIRLDEDFPEVESFDEKWKFRHDESSLEWFLTGVYENFGEYIFDDEDDEEDDIDQKEIDRRDDEIYGALIDFLDIVTDGTFDEDNGHLKGDDYWEYIDKIRENVLWTLGDLGVWVYAPTVCTRKDGPDYVEKYPYNTQDVTNAGNCLEI